MFLKVFFLFVLISDALKFLTPLERFPSHSYEMSGPDYLNPDSFVPMVRMVYEQCLCCFRFNPEVWISASQFEQHALQRRAEAAGSGTSAAAALDTMATTPEMHEQAVTYARNVLVEGIEANPGVALLRCALAELEEGAGGLLC